jgi:hypothetical protein
VIRIPPPPVRIFFNSPRALTAAVITLALFAAHVLWVDVGFNIVLRNYFAGDLAFLGGRDPYAATVPLGASNLFLNSPQFALLAGCLSRAGTSGQTVLPWVPAVWVLGGAALFAFGLCRWHDFAKPACSCAAGVCATLALMAMAVDFLVSTGVYQVNAAVIALVLLGLAAYRDRHFAAAGALLLAATNLKIYPIIFLAALALRFNKRFWLGAGAAGVVSFMLPMLLVGWTHNFATHLAWVRATLAVTDSYTILDLRSAFGRVGWAGGDEALRWFVAALTVPAFFIHGVAMREVNWRPWFACAAAATLLLSPRTEVFTYVFLALAPAYVLMADWCAMAAAARWRCAGAWLFALSAAFIASARFVDPLWFKSENPHEIQRVLGALVFWGATTWILLADLWRRWMKPAPAVERAGAKGAA